MWCNLLTFSASEIQILFRYVAELAFHENILRGPLRVTFVLSANNMNIGNLKTSNKDDQIAQRSLNNKYSSKDCDDDRRQVTQIENKRITAKCLSSFKAN